MRPGLSLFAAAAVIALAPPAVQAATLPAVHEAVVAAVDSKAIPGAIVLVRHGGKVVHEEAYGVADAMPLKTDTVFWVASMTKPVVAASVLMMVDEGKVKLDDPVSKYIPEFAKPRMVRVLKPGSPPPGGPADGPKPEYDLVPANRALTVRDFLTMTAGLQTIRIANPAIPPVAMDDTVATFVPKLADAPLDFQPGSRWGYSNATEFEILVRVVEVASGQPYAEFMKARVFGPLGMKDSGFGVRADLESRTAPLGNMANSPLRFGKFTSGSAGLWTTAEDYGRFAQMLSNGGTLDGKRYLKAETVKAMSSNQIGEVSLAGVSAGTYGGMPEKTNPAIKYGFGVNHIVDPVGAGVSVPAGSFGWDGVGTRRFWVLPGDTVVVMLIPGGQADAAHRSVENAVMKTYPAK